MGFGVVNVVKLAWDLCPNGSVSSLRELAGTNTRLRDVRVGLGPRNDVSVSPFTFQCPEFAHMWKNDEISPHSHSGPPGHLIEPLSVWPQASRVIPRSHLITPRVCLTAGFARDSPESFHYAPCLFDRRLRAWFPGVISFSPVSVWPQASRVIPRSHLITPRVCLTAGFARDSVGAEHGHLAADRGREPGPDPPAPAARAAEVPGGGGSQLPCGLPGGHHSGGGHGLHVQVPQGAEAQGLYCGRQQTLWQLERRNWPAVALTQISTYITHKTLAVRKIMDAMRTAHTKKKQDSVSTRLKKGCWRFSA